MTQQSGEDGWRQFLQLCTKMKTVESLEEFFDFFLTPEEKTVIAARYRITNALVRNELTQREMAEELHVSIAKITRGSNALKRIGESQRNFLAQQMR